jgi:putative transposase
MACRVQDSGPLSAVELIAERGFEGLAEAVALSEAEVHWREFLMGLVARGLHGVRLIVSDDHAGL